MLAAANRIRSGSDYQVVSRRGTKYVSSRGAIFMLATPATPVRFGFIVTRQIGNAVVRNRVRRRLKAAARGIMADGLIGLSVVYRAFEPAHNASVAEFATDFATAFERGGNAAFRSGNERA